MGENSGSPVGSPNEYVPCWLLNSSKPRRLMSGTSIPNFISRLPVEYSMISVPSKWYSVRRNSACAPPPMKAPDTFNCGSFIQTVHLVIVVTHEQMELVHKLGGDEVNVTSVDLMFEKQRVGPNPGKNDSTHTLILYRLVLLGVADPELISPTIVMKTLPDRK
jgi:hypothetical protein